MADAQALAGTRPSTSCSRGFALAAGCALLLPVFPLSILLLTGIGLGIGATVTCASTTVMNAAPPERAGMAASIEEVGFELGGAVGIAVFGSLLTAAYAMSLVLPERLAATCLPRCGIPWMKPCWSPIPWRLTLPVHCAKRDAPRFRRRCAPFWCASGLLWLATGVLIARPGSRKQPT